MRLQQGTKRVNERSASKITAVFLNESDVPTAPSSARYRIDDITSNRNSPREVLDWTAIASPSTSETITITGTQNRILSDANEVEKRIVTVEGTGSDGEAFRQGFIYEINNLPGGE